MRKLMDFLSELKFSNIFFMSNSEINQTKFTKNYIFKQ